MDKNVFLKLNKNIDKSTNNLFSIPIILIVSLLISDYLSIFIAEKINMNENIIFTLFLTITIVCIIAISYINLSKYKKSMNERCKWILDNEEHLIKEEGYINEYEITSLVYLEYNASDKMNTKQTFSFKGDRNLVEITYLKNGQEHRTIAEAVIINDNPKYIQYIEFDKNGIYNLICK